MAEEKSKTKQTPKAKAKKPTFYTASDSSYAPRGGQSISIHRSLSYHGERADFTPFLSVPIKELEERAKASKAEEKKIHDQLSEAAKAWDEHGAQTLLLQKAIEYLKVPAVQHTNNEWKKQKDGSWEISNMVYKMTFSIVRHGIEWKLSWELSYTAPGLQHGYYGYTRTPRERIDHEGSKKYKTLDGAQNYIQLKFDQYASYFKTVSPPIPPAAKDLFCVNGQLLQGYTMGRAPAKKKEVTLEDLMACLKDSDAAGIGQKQEPEKEKPVSPAPKPGKVAPATEKADKSPPSPTSLPPVTVPKEKKPEAAKSKKPAPKPTKKKPLHTKKMKKSALAR